MTVTRKGEGNYQPRNVRVLQDVGALASGEADLMQRAARLHSDSRTWQDNPVVSDKALELLGTPTIAKSLFPEEKALEKKLWDQLDWPEAPKALPALEVRPEAIIDVSEVGTGFGGTTSSSIDSLPADLQEIAQRASFVVHNEMRDTVSLKEIEAAQSNDVFLPSEQSALGRLRGTLVQEAQIPGTAMTAILEVPRPGVERLPLPHSGSTPIFVVSTIKIDETVTVKAEVASPIRTLNMTREFHFEVDVPEGEHVVLMNHYRPTASKDHGLGAGTHSVDLIEGPYRIERWKDGERLEVSDVNIQAPERQEHDLHPYSDYELRNLGIRVPRVITKVIDHTDMHSGGATSQIANFVHSFDVEPDPKLDATPFETRHALKVEPGRYLVDNRLTIDVFDGGAVRARIEDGEFFPLERQEYNDDQVVGVVEPPDGRIGLNVRMSKDGLVKADQAYASVAEVQLGPEFKIN